MAKRNTNGLTAEGYIPLDDLWYSGERVVRELCAWLGWTPADVTRELNQQAGGAKAMETSTAGAFARRWNELTSGRQAYVRLPWVDELCTMLDVNLTVVLGEADVHSTCPPGNAVHRGWIVGPPATYAELAADPTLGRCDHRRRPQREAVAA